MLTDKGIQRNNERAERARATVEWYKANQLEESGEFDDTTIRDLISDCLHLVRRTEQTDIGDDGVLDEKEIIESTIRMAVGNFEAEEAGDDD